jgi:hypothetical protein
MATPVALPISGGAASAAPNADEVEYYMTLFEHYTQKQLEKETASRNKARQASALATMAARGKTILDKFFKKKVEAGEAQGVGAMLETAFGAAETAKPSVAARMQAAASTAAASASKALGDFHTWASAKVGEGGPKAKEWAGRAAAAFAALPGVIRAAWGHLRLLTNIERIGIIDARNGTVTLPGAPSLKLNANTNRFFLVDRYKEFTKDELKQHLAKFSEKYSLSSATRNQLTGIVKKMILDQADWRFIKNRYSGTTKKLISNENWNKIKRGETTLQQTLARLKLTTGNGNRVGTLNTRYTLATRTRAAAQGDGPPPTQQKSNSKIMNNASIKAALENLYAVKPNLFRVKSSIEAQVSLQADTAAAKAMIARLRAGTSSTNLKKIYGVEFNNRTRLENLLTIRARRDYVNWNKSLKNAFNSTLRQKMYSQGSDINSGNFDYQKLASVLRAINAAENTQSIAGASTYMNSLKRAINGLGSRSNRVRVNEDKLARIAAATRGLRRVTGVTSALRNAQGRIARLRREENASRRNRGLAPLPVYNNRGSSRIPYYPTNVRPSSYGNMRPGFAPPPNRPQPGIVPMPPPLQPFPAIPANNRSPNMRPENLLPPTEAAAVTNVGGINKAINLVENAGGPSNIVKTANILKNVGNNPNAAVAAGANAKNVKIVLQLGGANNALKVASAVPKLKKRRRSKAKKAAPKPKAPRVKELKKLIKFLGTKEELVKKLPDPENKEKKLTKNQVVAKITTHLLRKGRKAKK